ncbi:hypothetical protein Gogos_010234, partial [Gossypium gossypioides]|nr:hypothetical protein [Gossypium gossypioides]
VCLVRAFSVVDIEVVALSLDGGEDEAWQLHADERVTTTDTSLCLVKTFLTATVIQFQTIHTTLATLWHPHGRILISDLGEKGYLFEFYYAIDINRVIDGNPWTFNKHILVIGFYPVQIVYGKKEIPFEWGLSIKGKEADHMKILSWNVWGLRSPWAMCCLRLIEEARHCQSWDLLCRLSSRDPTPWLVMGDFNEIAFSHEKQGSRLHGEQGMEAFWLTLNDYDLSNLGFEGRWCTWEQGRFSLRNIREQLDRGVSHPKFGESEKKANRYEGYLFWCIMIA